MEVFMEDLNGDIQLFLCFGKNIKNFIPNWD